MTTPQVGITHDVVLYANNSVFCGVTVKPFTYRVQNAPMFISRLTIGDQTGLDKARWRSFIQSRFDGGSGQYTWGGQTGNDKFAYSNWIDTGAATIGLGNVVPTDPSSRYSNVDLAIEPLSQTNEVPGLHGNFDFEYKTSKELPLVTMSNRPHVFGKLADVCYTNVGATAWELGVYSGYRDKNTGTWVVMNTRGAGAITHPVKVINYSNVIVAACLNTTIQMYGTKNTDGSGTPVWYSPSYTTHGSYVIEYDEKIWRAYKHKISYLQPAVNTLDAIWSDEYTVGGGEETIVKMVAFNGRLYIAKRNGLWVYDAGTIYQIVDTSAKIDDNNFGLLLNHNGYLYYNVQEKVYRLSSAGLIEELLTPWTTGLVLSGVGDGSEVLIVHMVSPGSNSYRAVWVFDTETGGFRRWFKSSGFNYLGLGKKYEPKWLGSNSGMVWIWPCFRTDQVVYGETVWVSSWATADRKWKQRDLLSYAPIHYQVSGSAYLVTSRFELGFPDLTKLFNRMIVRYYITSHYDNIDVYYAADLDCLTPWSVSSWTLLGQIGHGSLGDQVTGEKSLSFPDGFVAKKIMFKFELIPNSPITPLQIVLHEFELEYVNQPSDLEVVDFVALAINEVERLDMQVENSGAFVAATLWSMSRSPLAHVVGLPWPTAHTIRAIVNINPPGGFTPAMVYNSLGQLDAEIPIRLEEM